MPALLQRLNQASPPAHRNKRKIPAFRNFRLFYKMSNPAHYLEALNVGFSYLIGFTDNRYVQETNTITELFLSLPDEGKKELLNFARYLAEKAKNQE
jgi:hypothetical protein